jgi:hypothetical protein
MSKKLTNKCIYCNILTYYKMLLIGYLEEEEWL